MLSEDKKKTLDLAMAAIDRNYGKGSVMRLGNDNIEPWPSISTGALTLDMALGIGGLPFGRIVEIYGPESSGKSTLALSVVAEAQKRELGVAYIDAEHALDPTYMRNVGVDLGDLILAQPDSGEQALRIAETLIKTGVISVVVIDSVAGLTPQAQIDGEIGDNHMALLARLMSQALGTLKGSIAQANCCVIFINQIREKPGVMYGCLHGSTLVNFVDGRSLPIKTIVDNKISGNVWAWNEKESRYEAAPIVDWHYNGDVERKSDWIHIETSAIDSLNGTVGFTVTPDHKVLTSQGWIEAKKIDLKTKVATKLKTKINSTLADFLWGSFIGSSTIHMRSSMTANLKFQDRSHPEYLKWKISKLEPFYEFKYQSAKYISKANAELALAKKELGQRNPEVFFQKHYSDMGLAVWFMDDAHLDISNNRCRYILSIRQFKGNIEKLNNIRSHFDKMGFVSTVNHKTGTFYFDVTSTQKIADCICKYVPPCMDYKLPIPFKNRYEDFDLTSELQYVQGFVQVKSIRNASDRQMRMKGKYDISIANYHNYLVGNYTNGITVHNSPETTPGGRALKFYSSVRIEVRKADALKDKAGQSSGIRVKAKVLKNKMAPALRLAEYDVLYGRGIDTFGCVVDAAILKNVIVKSGAWFDIRGTKAQGRDGVVELLANDLDLFDSIKKEVVNHV